MRKFLPIKGPGGRYLTLNEKVALLILGLTLVLCVLTLFAGEGVYAGSQQQNPVFSVVAGLCRTLGGGIVALYGLVLLWSGLIYFKGERVANVAPLGGRLAAGFAVMVGVSGALGIAQLHSAGGLGDLVGGAVGNTLGAGAGFPVLLMLMLLGFHLAGQGLWAAFREPIPAMATANPASPGLGYEAPSRRFAEEPALPDDGDPSADERSLAVTQAMEEIERSQGVTIVDVEPESRPSIGEEVDAAPPPDPETEEAEVQRGLEAVENALAPDAHADAHEDEDEDEPAATDEHDDVADEDEDQEEEEQAARERYSSAHHGLVPVPVGEDNDDDDDDDDDNDNDNDDDDEEEAEEAGEYEEAEHAAEEEVYVVVEDDETAGDDDDLGDEEAAEDVEDEEAEADADAEDEAGYEEAEADEEADEDDGYEEAEADEEADEDDEYEEAEADEESPAVTPEDGFEAEELEEDGAEEADEDDADEDDADRDEAEREDLAVAAAAEDAGHGDASEEESSEQADGFAEEDGTDPYAQGGLLRRIQANHPEQGEDGRPYTSFDWRGRPLD